MGFPHVQNPEGCAVWLASGQTERERRSCCFRQGWRDTEGL